MLTLYPFFMQPPFEAPYVPNNLHCIAEEAEVHVVSGLVKITQIQSGGGDPQDLILTYGFLSLCLPSLHSLLIRRFSGSVPGVYL